MNQLLHTQRRSPHAVRWTVVLVVVSALCSAFSASQAIASCGDYFEFRRTHGEVLKALHATEGFTRAATPQQPWRGPSAPCDALSCSPGAPAPTIPLTIRVLERPDAWLAHAIDAPAELKSAGVYEICTALPLRRIDRVFRPPRCND